jgi:hypothetical protein
MRLSEKEMAERVELYAERQSMGLDLWTGEVLGEIETEENDDFGLDLLRKV